MSGQPYQNGSHDCHVYLTLARMEDPTEASQRFFVFFFCLYIYISRKHAYVIVTPLNPTYI